MSKLIQSQQETSKAFQAIAKHSRKRRVDHDKDRLAPDSDEEVDSFDWAAWLRSASIPAGGLRGLSDTGYFDSPKHVGKLVAASKDLPHGVPYLSAQDVSWWEPPYIVQNLSSEERKRLQSSRRSSQDLGPFLGNVATWGLAHIAAGSFDLSDPFVYFFVLLRLQDEYGASFSKKYHTRLVEDLLSKIRAGEHFTIGPYLCNCLLYTSPSPRD